MSAHSSAVVLDDLQRGVEVMAQATRRQFTAEYTLRVLQEADACRKPGEIGALLRREGLAPSHLCPLCQERCRAGFSQIWGREMRVSRGNESEVFTRV